MRIDAERLIRLGVLIQHGSFGRAAEQLCVTQPALSQSIAQIEKEVGVKLIERTPHGVEPTVYGRVLYEHAQTVDRELALAAQQIQELAAGRAGALTVGTTTGAAATLVARGVCNLLESSPGTLTRIVEGFSIKPLMSQLRDRTFDMLICQRPQELELSGTRAVSLFRVKRVACVRTGHPLTGNYTLRDLVTYPFVCPPEDVGSLFGFPQIFSTVGLQPPEILVSNSIYVAKEIVLNSNAFALFSDLSIIEERERFQIMDLEVPTQYWMQLILRAEQPYTALMKAFLTEIIAVCKDLKIDIHADAFDFRKSSQSSGRSARRLAER